MRAWSCGARCSDSSFQVWASVVALLLSGYGMVFLALGGFGAAGVHVHIMQAIGLLMIVLFLPVLRAVGAPAPRARGGRRPDGGAPARADSLDGRDQSGARSAHLGDRRERPLLGLGRSASREMATPVETRLGRLLEGVQSARAICRS